MIFCHIIDDYVLQGILAQMKQKKWWVDKIPEGKEHKYSKDYIVALIVHAFSWAFMIMLPVLWFIGWTPTIAWIVLFPINWVLHAIIDDLKANRGKINLIQDQLVHLGQIIVTWVLVVIVFSP